MRIVNDIKLDFDDVLICPKRSDIGSRADIDLVREFTTLNSKQTFYACPVVSSNMDSTGTISMATELSKHKMLTCLHKFYSEDQLVEFFTPDNPVAAYTFYSLGITDDDIDKLISVSRRTPIHRLNVDVANGYSKYFVDKLRKIRDLFPEAILIAGNVATPGMTSELILTGGADIVKVGIGGGAACLTRMVTGVGVPQLSAVMECADACHGLNAHIMSDGGCRTPGDVVKAFAADADLVMVGSMFAGCDESEGEWVGPHDPSGVGKKLFKFYGMSSTEAMDKYAGGVAEYRASEGKCSYIEAKGPVKGVVQQILGGIRSACAYVGAKSIHTLAKCTTFVRVNKVHR